MSRGAGSPRPPVRLGWGTEVGGEGCWAERANECHQCHGDKRIRKKVAQGMHFGHEDRMLVLEF